LKQQGPEPIGPQFLISKESAEMVFENILNTVGAIYTAIAGNIISNVEKLSPGLAAWVQGFAEVINIQGNARALALLAVVGLVLGFIFFTVKLFCFKDDGCKGL